MINVNLEKCTGCGACLQSCPQQCILWTSGEFGFFYPQIDESACINCGLCERVCPIDKVQEGPGKQKVYAAVHKNADVLEKSTSGGAFTAIADAVFRQNGIVYGAAMQEGMKVSHLRVDDQNGLAKLRSSKYVQSDTGTTYRLVQQDLKQGKVVLYSGTPCQIDGLKRFLGKSYENLYTVDIICHGVGSQAYFDKYMDFAKKKYGKIKTLLFRSAGWNYCGTVIVDAGEKEKKYPYRDFDNYYYSYFLSGDIDRMCCYSCKYANTRRVGDFSLGDYWGVEALKLPLKIENGCSLLIVNNERGEKLLETITDLDRIETTIEQAARCNKQLNEPSKLPESRHKRLEEFETMTGEEIQKEYLRSHFKTVIKGRIRARMLSGLKPLIRSKRK